MPELFKEIIPAILQTKKNVFEEDDSYKEYIPFVVNRSLSAHIDCVLYVNEMNINSFLDPDIQNSFYLNSIRPMKRKFQPWLKNELPSDLECVKLYFGYSNKKAKEALSILSKNQLDEIKKKTDKGGVKK